MKTDFLCKALAVLYELQRYQGNYDEALILAEEAYNCGAVAYNPVHPKVQEAASTLIEYLIDKGDFYDAERYAQFTLDSLKDPGNGFDQQGEAVTRGYYDLRNVIFEQMGDCVEAETLVRESLRIRIRLHGAQHQLVGMSTGLLANILRAQNKLGSETKDLHERSLVITIDNSGPEGINTAAINFNMGNFYRRRAEGSQTAGIRKEQLLLSKAKYEEALRFFTNILGPDHPRSMQASSRLSIVSCKLSEV
jgi:tetratricopeptide (TPR) repeat protein